jgi:phosphoadenosine phosphosulfate reductase
MDRLLRMRRTADAIADRFAPLTLDRRLAEARAGLEGRLVLTTSFGIEDQALTHAAMLSGADIDIVTLDTGRLFPETYDVWAETEQRYGIRIRAYTPEQAELETLLKGDGVAGFRNSVDARHRCCEVRKVVPLARALDGAAGWITGLRADQSAHRAVTPFAEPDVARRLVKINPLADFTRDAVKDYVLANNVPYNVLHDRGFLSIGCAPCTRAIRPGEPERAGRWWWEAEDKKECGLHVAPVAEPIPQAA